MIYVDPVKFKKSKNGRKLYGHMIADTLEELHLFAEKIGIKKHFFHSTAKYPHYDVTQEQQELALQHGAQLVSSKEIIKLMRR